MGEAKRDYYEVLGVPRAADTEQLKRAFRSRAREFHPDVSDDPEAEEKFSELAEAYEVLSKPTARLLYDRFGYRGWGNGGLPDAPSPIPTGDEVLVEIRIEPLEAARGTTRNVELAFVAVCRSCRGEGALPGARWETCAACRGEGRLKKVSSSSSGRLLQIEQCGGCAGKGRVASETCPECGGSGRVRIVRTVVVDIPGGARDGQRICLADDARAYAVLRVEPLPDIRFVRHAATVGLALAVAALVALLFFS